jgi:hypothetical protein
MNRLSQRIIAMERLLRLLIIEDNADDAELMIHSLERCGFEPKWTRVDTAGALKLSCRTSLYLTLVPPPPWISSAPPIGQSPFWSFRGPSAKSAPSRR